jgi:c-di-GMP-binding flagellar brake protein YcgR
MRITFVIDGEKHYTVSKVVDVKEDSIYIFMPKYEEYKDFLEVGQNIEVYFWRTGDAGYNFTTKIKGIVDEFKGLLEIDHSNSIERTQRRHYFRIDTSLKLFFKPIREEQKSLLKESKHVSFPDEIKPYIGRILSISGGGISFVSDAIFPNGEILWLEIVLYKSQILSDIYGRIIRSKKVPENKFKLFIEFVLIEESEREIIVGFVTAKQREKVKV